MRALWEPQAKTQRWLDVEIAVCEGLAHFGQITADDVEKIKAGARFELPRIAELELETRHDVMAFVKNVQEHLGPEGQFVHYRNHVLRCCRHRTFPVAAQLGRYYS